MKPKTTPGTEQKKKTNSERVLEALKNLPHQRGHIHEILGKLGGTQTATAYASTKNALRKLVREEKVSTQKPNHHWQQQYYRIIQK